MLDSQCYYSMDLPLSTEYKHNLTNYDIYCERGEETSIEYTFMGEIQMWHREKYPDTFCDMIVDYVEDKLTIHYITKYNRFKTIVTKTMVDLTEKGRIHRKTDGFNIKTFLNRINREDISEYDELKCLNNRIKECIISRNEIVNEEYFNEMQELSSVEYVRDNMR